MNTDTGEIYRTMHEAMAAQERGEPIAIVSPLVAEAVTLGIRHIAQRTQERDQRAKRKAKAKQAKASRKAQRRGRK